MRGLGLAGARRGKRVRTTQPDTARPCPLDLVNRQFKAQRPDQLWVADLTYQSTWQGQMFVAFVIDVYARRIVGWRTSSHMRTDFVVDALEQALYGRQPAPQDGGLIHHSDKGSQYPLCATPSVWLRRDQCLLRGVLAIPTTTRWPRPSTACTKRRSSTNAGHGKRVNHWSWRRCSGCIGLTTTDC